MCICVLVLAGDRYVVLATIQDNSVLLCTCSSFSNSRCFTVPATFSGTAFRTQAKKQFVRCNIVKDLWRVSRFRQYREDYCSAVVKSPHTRWPVHSLSFSSLPPLFPLAVPSSQELSHHIWENLTYHSGCGWGSEPQDSLASYSHALSPPVTSSHEVWPFIKPARVKVKVGKGRYRRCGSGCLQIL